MVVVASSAILLFLVRNCIFDVCVCVLGMRVYGIVKVSFEFK